MNFSEKLRPYLAGELPLEEVRVLEAALATDPALAMEWQLMQLEERDIPAWINGEPGLDFQSWRPGLEALHRTDTPLWFLSLLAGTIVVAGVGVRRKKGTPRNQPFKETAEEGHHRSDENSPSDH